MSVQTKELIIPVPWGHIAGKAWGNEDDEIVFAFHGSSDNAGTFDRLIPLLPPNFYYICFDMPSHGRSSPMPTAGFIHTIDYLPVYHLLVRHFKKESYIFLGHSFGALIAQLFSRLYPRYVKKLVMLDCVIMEPVKVEDYQRTLVKRIDRVIKTYDQLTSTPPSYSYQEVLEKIKFNRFTGQLSTEEAIPLLNRCIQSVGNGKYILTTDQRMKALVNPLHDKQYAVRFLELLPISCPVLFVLSNNTHPRIADSYTSLEVVKKWKNAVVKFVDGNHDVHITHPERVAPYVTEFLISYQSKL